MIQIKDIIAIGCDHAGFCMKEYLLKTLQPKGYNFRDYGTFSENSVDYPDFIHPLAKDINDGTIKWGIIICGSGNGVAMTANKYPNVRAALCWNEQIVKLSRMHNDSNVIALPARFIDKDDAVKFITLFFITDFEGERHERRVKKISQIR
jgi:ribose 5-phosphate isomerase B